MGDQPQECVTWDLPSGTRIRPPVQGTRVLFLVPEDLTCYGTTMPGCHSR